LETPSPHQSWRVVKYNSASIGSVVTTSLLGPYGLAFDNAGNLSSHKHRRFSNQEGHSGGGVDSVFANTGGIAVSGLSLIARNLYATFVEKLDLEVRGVGSLFADAARIVPPNRYCL
jgi:hypothetical protein